MSNALIDLAYQLAHTGESFVLATVVWCERPTSAKPGAQAIIQADGQITGWIGGSCTQGVVLREAARLLREGGEPEPYLMRIGASDMGVARSDVRVFPMACASGGAVDIYMEPHLPQPRLLLVGESPVIDALSRLAAVLNFAVSQLLNDDLSKVQLTEQTYTIVATHGLYDEEVLAQVLRSPARYVGMVGSRKRAEACRVYLRSVGLTEAQIARLRTPVGLDLGAITPEEIAASILAELVLVRRRGLPREENSTSAAIEEETRVEENVSAVSGTAVDPVCGMDVEIANARHHSRLAEQDYYFCCPACKRLFESNPQAYLVPQQ
ncbi:MAG: XdhC family protein [Ktedonobacteraceae bacterium]